MIKRIYTIVCTINLITALTAFGMESDITYPCDLCQEEKTELSYIGITSKTKTCDHILCQKCDDMIEKSQDGPIEIDPCVSCSYMDCVRNKQCWKTIQTQVIDIDMQYDPGISAEYFKENYPNRILPDITDTTSIPDNPIQYEESIPTIIITNDEPILLPIIDLPTINAENDTYPFEINDPTSVLPDITDTALLPIEPIRPAQKPAHQNPNQPTQPAPQNPDNLPTKTNSVSNNKIKWLGATCITGLICYGAYKAYMWWISEDTQEEDDNGTQEDWEKEEAKLITF